MIALRAGFLPLLDCAILIAAKEKGFAEEQGIALTLFKETSWANIRDRVSIGQFDVAHMLAPMPIAQNLGLTPLHVPLVAPFALGLGGNAVTVSNEVYGLMSDVAEQTGDPQIAGISLRQVIEARGRLGLPNLVFAVVHGFSVHAYELRYWLAASGIDPDKNVSITIVPPILMADALASGAIDGFCVGEPWNTNAVALGVGEVIATKASIWRSSPEKVLGMRKMWAEENPERLSSLLLALYQSATWCADPGNVEVLCEILAAPANIGVDQDVLRKGLSGNVLRGKVQNDFLLFADRAANFPWVSHALWIYSQMIRWGQLRASVDNEKRARASYRPDLYRQTLKSHGVAMPGGSSKVEGGLNTTTRVPSSDGTLMLGPDGFFDGVIFDPDHIDVYLASLANNAALHKH